MNRTLNDEILCLLDKQPLLKMFESEKEYKLSGIYEYSLEHNGFIDQGNRKIEIVVNKKFPDVLPKLFVFDYPKEMEHIYVDGSVCLATIGEMINFINKTPSLLAFVDKFINSFIFSLDWFEKYKSYPFGEREHGYKGLLDYYLNDLNLTFEQYKKMLLIIANNRYRGHSQCICGSNKRLRDCHGKFILPIIKNEILKNMFLYEGYLILTEDGKNDKNKSAK
ncbi:hypothetical protein [Enterococcus cecorum]|uniref:hypothetical protein n=1 Tax=Enterococcus cecorum TaxID=44008 RepID=UPI00200B4068|nr:hypothetical protein [Enterococcus cecorum]